MAAITYKTVVETLYDALPEFYDEVMANDEEFDEEERRSPYTVFLEFPSWFLLLGDEGRHEVVERAASFIERAAEDAQNDAELENVLLVQLGEGFPFSRRAWNALGPAARELIVRGNDGRLPPVPDPTPSSAIEDAISRLRREAGEDT